MAEVSIDIFDPVSDTGEAVDIFKPKPSEPGGPVGPGPIVGTFRPLSFSGILLSLSGGPSAAQHNLIQITV